MAQNKLFTSATYPLPVYNYRVSILGDSKVLPISFSEVSGLHTAYEPVTYRHGMSFKTGIKIVPGMKQSLTITLKKGVTRFHLLLQSWINDVYKHPEFTRIRRDILIELCDENSLPAICWLVQKAVPIKLEVPVFDANSNEVAIETMEVMAQNLKTIDIAQIPELLF